MTGPDLFGNRKSLAQILQVPAKVVSVYSLVQHVWAGESDPERRESRKKNRVRLETLDEFFIDPVRHYLDRILGKIADNEGQGFWVQAEFGVGKSHLLAATSILAVGGGAAWDRVKKREDEEKRAGPGARLDNLWRKRLEKRKLFPVIISLEGCGGSHEKKLEDFILQEAQDVFALREGKPLAVFPEEHLAELFLKQHHKPFEEDLRRFVGDKRLMQGLPQFDYDELIAALKAPEKQRDSGRVLAAFYRHRKLSPQVPTERGERLARAVQDILESGYDGVFIAIDEMSEFLRRSNFLADEEDCLQTLSNTLAKARGLPIWLVVAAQMKHTNPQKIIAPDRLREEILEHKEERFRDIVVQRTRTIKDPAAVRVYFDGYRNLLPWARDASREDFDAAFPFPPDAIATLRRICTQLTGTRSTIFFLHRALQQAVERNDSALVPIWQVFDDLMSFSETPSTTSTGAVSVRSRFRDEVAALESAQATLKKINEGRLARKENRSRAERILMTLFLYSISGIGGLTKEQILDVVCDLKPGEDMIEAQLGHYETLLEEMKARLRQIKFREGRYEFVKRETTEYDDLLGAAIERLKADPQLLWQQVDRLLSHADPEAPSPFAEFIAAEEGRQQRHTLYWHGQERTGRVAGIDITRPNVRPSEIDTHGNEDDFLVIIARRPVAEKKVEEFLQPEGKPADPRLIVWTPAELKDHEKAALASVLAHALVMDENRDTALEKEGRREFKQNAARGFTLLREVYARGVARTSRTSLDIPTVGGVDGAVDSMAAKALETCYRSRSIDFGNRRFDTTAAVKLVNGLVRNGKAVGAGDQLWSAVENFAPALGLVRPPILDRLDPTASPFYPEIRARVEERGGAGIPVATVYNWFTGFDPKDGSESMGLTRRMVDIYLLCMARLGVIRISDKKGGWFIDRTTIGTVDFKPDTLKNLGRIDLPRAPQNWQILHPYLECLVGAEEGSLGPKYEQATAVEALRALHETHWPRPETIQWIDRDIKLLFRELGKEKVNPFDDLLLFWLNFSEAGRPEVFAEEEMVDALRRGVLAATLAGEVKDLTSDHLSAFRERRRGWLELVERFGKTSVKLQRAARLAGAPVPEGPAWKEIRKAQKEITTELQKAAELVLDPDKAAVRLDSKLDRLGKDYVDMYVEELVRLGTAQAEVNQACEDAEAGGDLPVLEDLTGEVPEARRLRNAVRDEVTNAPRALRGIPEKREAAEAEVRSAVYVRTVTDNQDLTLVRIVAESGERARAAEHIAGAGAAALRELAAFLRSAGVSERLRGWKDRSAALTAIVSAKDEDAVMAVLRGMPAPGRKALGKELKAVLGGSTAKTVCLSGFTPTQSVIWEEREIDAVAAEFKEFLKKAWEKGRYLKIEE